MTYLNAAGHGLPDPAVRARMIAYMRREDEIGPAAAEHEAAPEMAAVTSKAARIIEAQEEQVVLVPTTTIGWNMAVLSLRLAGRRVLVAPGEWASDIPVLQRMGAKVEVMPLNEHGALDLNALESLIDDDLGAICAPMVSSLTGECYPVAEIGALQRPEGCAFVVDAAQAVGQMPVSVRDLNCDVLAATTRKWLRAPRDTALLYVSEDTIDRMGPNPAPRLFGITIDGTRFGDQPGVRRFDPGSVFAPQRLGQGVALDLFLANQEKTFAQLAVLAGHARSRAGQAGIALAGTEANGSTIISCRLPRNLADARMPRLRAAGIEIKDAGPDCEPMRGLSAGEGAFLRLSPHVYNTKAEIDQVFDILAG